MKIEGYRDLSDDEVDRMTVETEFQRLAWAQWSETEIATGEPFARLLRDR